MSLYWNLWCFIPITQQIGALFETLLNAFSETQEGILVRLLGSFSADKSEKQESETVQPIILWQTVNQNVLIETDNIQIAMAPWLTSKGGENFCYKNSLFLWHNLSQSFFVYVHKWLETVQWIKIKTIVLYLWNISNFPTPIFKKLGLHN